MGDILAPGVKIWNCQRTEKSGILSKVDCRIFTNAGQRSETPGSEIADSYFYSTTNNMSFKFMVVPFASQVSQRLCEWSK